MCFLALMIAPHLSSRLHDKYILSKKSSIVQIYNAGTGFRAMYKGKGYIVTNSHVCKDVSGFIIYDQDGNKYERNVIKTGSDIDICILEDIPQIPALELAVRDIEEYEDIYTIGYPGMDKISIFKGKYMSDMEITMPCLTADMKEHRKTISKLPPIFAMLTPCLKKFPAQHILINGFPGGSGSPVLNALGQVVGIYNIVNMHAITFSKSVSVKYLKEFLDNL